MGEYYEWWMERESALVSVDEALGGEESEPKVDEGGMLLEMIEEGNITSIGPSLDDKDLVISLAGLSVPIDQTAEALDITETMAEALAKQKYIEITERMQAEEERREPRI